MSDTPVPPPYTGSSSAASSSAPVPEFSGPPQPAFPTEYTPRPVTWHSHVLLIVTGAVALVAAILTTIGGQGFPGNAPIEQLQAFGLTIDLVAVAIVMAIFTVVEYRRRADPNRRALPTDTRRSVLAIVGVALSGVALLAWAAMGGGEQVLLGFTRYMYSTGSLFVVGIPWALGIVFGAWGYRPGAHRVTNVLALVAVVVGLLLAVPTTYAALIYGAGLSD